MLWLLSHQSGPIAQSFNQGISAVLASIAWVMFAKCCVAALASLVCTYQRCKPLDTHTTLESLAANGWCEFELLVFEAFCLQGNALDESGLGGADGVIDLILRKDGSRTLVQCKQWKRQQVGVSVGCEMHGLLAHHNADAVNTVCSAPYPKDDERFAQGSYFCRQR
ncbi:restriction endonuclease [Xanthomonas hortorum]|uniref:Restriction endonuclease n=1 Tax=Xanthomonas hortorum TaxID=56454 RepID=A0AA47EUD7_9XANT|nr:restriction endonuclease [Xanthomonas hortorum]WAH64513.1 restriction endonuclease [Xanthomonas hortorum]